MKGILIGALGILGLGAAAGAVAIYGGLVDVAADSPHRPAVVEIIELAREQAVARAARDIALPPDLADGERVRRGAGNYDAMCAGCHLAPGMDNSEIRRGLYPAPPDLAAADRAGHNDREVLARQFWIIKHGIKASGMPAWSKGGMADGDIWDLVAFLRQLPTLAPQQYRSLVASSEGHSHGGMDHAHPAAPAEAAKPHHDHAGHSHRH